jgi:hypothetical protein
MRATTLLFERRHRVQELVLDMMDDIAARDERHVELLEAVGVLVVVEQAAMHLLAPVDADALAHKRAHERARAALFRLAASATRSGALASSLRELAEVFGARSRDLCDRLAGALDEAELLRFGSRLTALIEGLARPRVSRARAGNPSMAATGTKG